MLGIFLVRVRGESMWPYLVSGRRYFALSFLKPQKGDVVAAQTADGVVIKYVSRAREEVYELSGSVSWSSRYEVGEKDMLGVLVWARVQYLGKNMMSTVRTVLGYPH